MGYFKWPNQKNQIKLNLFGSIRPSTVDASAEASFVYFSFELMRATNFLKTIKAALFISLFLSSACAFSNWMHVILKLKKRKSFCHVVDAVKLFWRKSRFPQN